MRNVGLVIVSSLIAAITFFYEGLGVHSFLVGVVCLILILLHLYRLRVEMMLGYGNGEFHPLGSAIKTLSAVIQWVWIVLVLVYLSGFLFK